MALQVGPYYVLPDGEQSWKDKNIHTSVGAVALKKTGSRLFETTCREGENSRHVVFFMPASACCCRFGYWGKIRPQRCLAGKNKR